jgi:hypothetical protein
MCKTHGLNIIVSAQSNKFPADLVEILKQADYFSAFIYNLRENLIHLCKLDCLILTYAFLFYRW